MSQHHRESKWATASAKARANIKASMPLPCVECGGIVTPDMAWDVGHITPLSQGGNVNQYGASHRSCNRSAGGKLGAQKINQHKKSFRQW